MNILMLTNTFTPHVGGVARSVETFAQAYRDRGHRVIVVAPEFEDVPAGEVDVIRIPALQNFNGSDFSVRLPLPGYVASALEDFKPDIIHAHHPFLLGDNAMRLASSWNVPLVFTHHTMYEQYTHYVPGDSSAMQRFIIDLTTRYANLCDCVFAPSESVASVIRQRGVLSRVEVVPTGVDVARFQTGDGAAVRRQCNIPDGAFVVGHLGRLAPEKNLEFLAKSVAEFLRRRRDAHFIVVGSGPSEEAIRRLFRRRRLRGRLHMLGTRTGQALVDAYHAMDVFAFASQSETQGMVLTEAMAAGVPVVAVDASGAREVVVDRRNGRLLATERRASFASALAWVADASPAERDKLRQAARETADTFSIANCADRAIGHYEAVIHSERRARFPEDSTLDTLGRMLGTEWELWSRVAYAAGQALQGRHLWKMPVLGPIVRRWRHFRRAISRSEWGARLLGLSRSEGTATEPGIILVQIDGFSRAQFERALRRSRMPYLRKLMSRSKYQLHTMYSGVPSTTPSVQGELFYGVRQAVPAFSFVESDTGEAVWMLDPEEAARVQSRIARNGEGLLRGGSAYSNIYTGGAAEPHFCASAMGWGDLLQGASPLAKTIFTLSNIPSLIRALVLVAFEIVLAFVDGLFGSLSGRNPLRELKFIPARVGVNILLRDLISIGAAMDAARGLPIVQLNFLGFDEQAHHRGPGSNFAHWTLKGIDRSIRRVAEAARNSTRRDYQVWIYSDHGQEHSIPYYRETGKTVQEAIGAVLNSHVEHVKLQGRPASGIEGRRAKWLGGGRAQGFLPQEKSSARVGVGENFVVTALGPIGSIYPGQNFDGESRQAVAERLVREAQIPLVLTCDGNGAVGAFTAEGQFRLPEDAAAVLGADHPFLEATAEDLINLCRHRNSGSLLICGWRKQGQPISFVLEQGAHGGPGPEETRAFALLPADAPLETKNEGYLLPGELRAAAMHVLGRRPRIKSSRPPAITKRDTVRVLTYNVHTCIGMDGKLSPSRIARVISQCDADVVALQELDVRRPRTGDVDQAHEIARLLEMEFHFHPSVQIQEELYGDAILSRLPMKLVSAGRLPGLDGRPRLEPRGALWVSIDVNGRPLQFINTHLGLSPRERMNQIEALMGAHWLEDERCQGPLVLCGDFNAMPRSQVYRRVAGRLRDVQKCLNGHRPQRTWFSRYPLGRIDHIFVNNDIEVVKVEVPRGDLMLMASDHLPLITEIRLK